MITYNGRRDGNWSCVFHVLLEELGKFLLGNSSTGNVPYPQRTALAERGTGNTTMTYMYVLHYKSPEATSNSNALQYPCAHNMATCEVFVSRPYIGSACCIYNSIVITGKHMHKRTVSVSNGAWLSARFGSLTHTDTQGWQTH